MPVSFDLTLLERQPDRVVVTISLCPGDDPVKLDGVAVEILNSRRERVSPRLLLPVAGTLVGPLVTQAELRAFGTIPTCSVVSGTAWSGEEVVETLCPADDHIGLEAHVRGVNAPILRSEAVLLDLLPDELDTLQRRFAWLQPHQREGWVRPLEPLDGDAPPRPDSELFEPDLEGIEGELDSLCGDLGLDEECTEWLKDLMKE